MTLVFIMIGTVAITAWITLTGARLQQSERLSVEVQRHVAWGNSKAINQQYAYTWAMRDNVTRPLSTATLGGWGGSDADPFTALKAFRSTMRPSNATTNSYPFNNIRNVPTPDNGVYFARTTADSDNSQTEHLAFYNYFKTYPAALLGDLMVVHQRPAAASGTFELSDNIRVNGRVVIWDAAATTENLRAESSVCANAAAKRTTKNTSGSALLMPQNWSATPVATAGYGGASQPTAVANGLLRMADNPDFTPGSIRHIIEGSGTYTLHPGPLVGSGVTGLIGSVLNGVLDLSQLPLTGTNPVVISRTRLSKIQLPTAAGSSIAQLLPPLSGNTSLLNIGVILADHPGLPHVRMTGTIDLVIVVGEILPLTFNATTNLTPRVIWVDQDSKARHVIFVGESNRQLVFMTGRGNGQDTYVGFLGVTQLLLGGPVRWRLQWINEFTRMNFVPPPLFSHVLCTGGLRTDWSFKCTDSGSSDRLILQRDASPTGIETLMPRDGWLEPYFLVR